MQEAEYLFIRIIIETSECSGSNFSIYPENVEIHCSFEGHVCL